MFVIRRNDGMYVARPGMAKSYTRDVDNAQRFATLEEAQRNCCPENEAAYPIGTPFGVWMDYLSGAK